MTNKLRSVIEESNRRIEEEAIDAREYTVIVQTLSVRLCKNLLKEANLNLLDAIIEEIEEQRWRTTKNSYNSAQNELIDFFTEKFKQAREELSTSLTQ